MLITATELVVPSGSMLEADLTIDLAAILRSEIRQDEVANVTPIKAGELLAEFNRSWRDIHSVISRLEAEKNKAEKEANKRKGILLLEEIPRILKDKGITSTADTRQAVIDTDGEYEILTDRFDQLRAAIFYLKGKLESFENAFTSTKKILGESTFNYGNMGGGPKGDTHSKGDPSLLKPALAPVAAGFGNARF